MTAAVVRVGRKIGRAACSKAGIDPGRWLYCIQNGVKTCEDFRALAASRALSAAGACCRAAVCASHSCLLAADFSHPFGVTYSGQSQAEGSVPYPESALGFEEDVCRMRPGRPRLSYARQAESGRLDLNRLANPGSVGAFSRESAAEMFLSWRASRWGRGPAHTADEVHSVARLAAN